MIDRGLMGVLLMKCGYTYQEALDLIDQMEMAAKKHGYKIRIKKLAPEA